MSLEIKNFNFRDATEEEYAALVKCRNQIRLEQLPDDPPIPLDEAIQGYKNIPDFIELVPWVAQDSNKNEILAYGLINFSREDNLHMAQFAINVLPEFRRQGLGKQFLARIIEVAQKEIKFIIRKILDTNQAELEFLEVDTAKLEEMIAKDWPTITYTEVLKILLPLR